MEHVPVTWSPGILFIAVLMFVVPGQALMIPRLVNWISVNNSHIAETKGSTDHLSTIETILIHGSYQLYILVTTEPHLTSITFRVPSHSTYMMFRLERANISTFVAQMERVSAFSIVTRTLFIVISSATYVSKIIAKLRQLEWKFKSDADWLAAVRDTESKDSSRTSVVSEAIVLCQSDVLNKYVSPDMKTISYTENFSHNKKYCYFQNLTTMPAETRQAMLHELFPNQHGLNNKTLKAGILPWPPFVYSFTRRGRTEYKGANIDLLTELGKALNFSIEYLEPIDGEWGQETNGQWTGLVGLLANRTVDFVIAPIVLTSARADVMDFTLPYYYDGAVLLLKPPKSTNTWRTLVKPFRPMVLLCIFSGFISTALFVFLLLESSPLGDKNNQWNWNNRWNRFGNILLYVYGILIQQGGWFTLRGVSVRTAIGGWCLFSMVVAATYRGNLIAFLTAQRKTLPFTSLSEMVQQDTYSWGILNGTSFVSLFKYSRVPDYKKVWTTLEARAEIDKDVLSSSDSVHFKKVLEEDYVFIGDLSAALMQRTNNCDLHVIKTRLPTLNYGIALTKDSDLTPVFSSVIQQWFERGLLPVLFSRWMPSPRCWEIGNDAKRADLPALLSAFYLVCIGVFLGGCVLLLERKFKHKLQHICSPSPGPDRQVNIVQTDYL